MSEFQRQVDAIRAAGLPPVKQQGTPTGVPTFTSKEIAEMSGGVAAVAPKDDPWMSAALKRGGGVAVGQLGATIRELGGEGVGSGLENYGKEVVEANPARTSFTGMPGTKGFTEAPMQFIGERVLESAAPMGAMAATGIGGRLAAGAAGVKGALGLGAATAAGMSAASAPMHMGEILQTQSKDPAQREIDGGVVAGTAFNTGLDTVLGVGGLMRGMIAGTGKETVEQLLKGGTKTIAERGLVKSAGAAAGKALGTAAQEGGIELAQFGSTQFAAKGQERALDYLASKEGITEGIENLAGGFFAGGAIRGATAPFEVAGENKLRAEARQELEARNVPPEPQPEAPPTTFDAQGQGQIIPDQRTPLETLLSQRNKLQDQLADPSLAPEQREMLEQEAVQFAQANPRVEEYVQAKQRKDEQAALEAAFKPRNDLLDQMQKAKTLEQKAELGLQLEAFDEQNPGVLQQQKDRLAELYKGADMIASDTESTTITKEQRAAATKKLKELEKQFLTITENQQDIVSYQNEKAKAQQAVVPQVEPEQLSMFDDAGSPTSQAAVEVPVAPTALATPAPLAALPRPEAGTQRGLFEDYPAAQPPTTEVTTPQATRIDELASYVERLNAEAKNRPLTDREVLVKDQAEALLAKLQPVPEAQLVLPFDAAPATPAPLAADEIRARQLLEAANDVTLAIPTPPPVTPEGTVDLPAEFSAADVKRQMAAQNLALETEAEAQARIEPQVPAPAVPAQPRALPSPRVVATAVDSAGNMKPITEADVAASRQKAKEQRDLGITPDVVAAANQRAIREQQAAASTVEPQAQISDILKAVDAEIAIAAAARGEVKAKQVQAIATQALEAAKAKDAATFSAIVEKLKAADLYKSIPATTKTRLTNTKKKLDEVNATTANQKTPTPDAEPKAVPPKATATGEDRGKSAGDATKQNPGAGTPKNQKVNTEASVKGAQKTKRSVGDAPASAPKTFDGTKLTENLRDNSAAEIGKMVNDYFTKMPGMSHLAAWAVRSSEGVKFQYVTKQAFEENGRPINAEYLPESHTIKVYPAGAHPAIVLHEMVHAATERAMARAQELLSSKTPLTSKDKALLKSYKSILTAYATVKKKLPEVKAYGLTNESEFIAETLSNPDFRAMLQTSAESGLWTRLVNAIRALVGLPKTDAVALNNVFMAAQTLAYNAPGATFLPAGVKKFYHTDISPDVEAMRNAVKLPTMPEKVWSGFGNSMRKMVLGLNTRHHISERFGAAVRGLKDIIAANDQQESLANSLQTDLGRVGQAYVEWAGKNKAGADKLMTAITLHSQFRLTQQQVYDLLAGKETYDSLLASERAAHDKPTSLLHLIPRSQFDRMVTALKESGWNDKPKHRQANYPMSKWGANEWGHKFFEMTSAEIDRTYDTQIRNMGFRLLRDEKIRSGSMKLNDVIDALLAESNQDKVSGADRDAVYAAKKSWEEAKKFPYMHTQRQGEYFLGIRQIDKDSGKRSPAVHFERFTTEIEARAAYNQLMQNSKKLEDMGLSVSMGKIADAQKEFTNTDGLMALANRIQKSVDDPAMTGLNPEQTEAIKESIRQATYAMMPENHVLKAMIHREGIIGWRSDEQFQGFMEHMSKSNHRHANDKFVTYIEDGFKSMQEHIKRMSDPVRYQHDAETAKDKQSKLQTDPVTAQMVYDEMEKRFVESMTLSPNAAVQGIRALTYHWQLSLNPAYLLVNMTQPYITTIPVLGARYGFTKAGTAFLQQGYPVAGAIIGQMVRNWGSPATNTELVDQLISSGKLPRRYENVVNTMLASGKVEFTLAKEAGMLATEYVGKAAKLSQTLSAGSHYTEVINRIASGITAYELEMERGGTEETANAAALWAIDQTQFNYSRMNQSRYLGAGGLLGKATPLFTVFLSFSISMMELYARNMRVMISKQYANDPAAKAEATKALVGMLTMTGLFAGALGLPFMGLIMAAANMLDDDEEGDIEEKINTYLRVVAGQTGGTAIAQGIPQALGLGIHSRASQADLVPYSRLIADLVMGDRTMKDMSAEQLLKGTSASFATGYGIKQLLTPDNIMRSVEGDHTVIDSMIRALPAVLRGPAQAAHGYYDYNGTPIPGNDELGDKVMQSFGLTPVDRQEQIAARMFSKDKMSRIKRTSDRIRRGYLVAAQENDTEDMAMWTQKAIEFKEKYPGETSPLVGAREALRKRTRDVAQMRLTGYGSAMDRRMLLANQEMLDAFAFSPMTDYADEDE